MKLARMNILYIACVVLLLPAVVTAAPEIKPDVITTEINDYFGYLKEFGGFQCQATGTNLKYSWKHNDIDINAQYILKFPKWNASTLQPLVNNIGTSYQGFYQCFVENSIGKIFGRRAHVVFTIIGDFNEDHTKPARMVNVVTGRPLALNCPAHAESQGVKYSWFYEEADTRNTLKADENYFTADNGTLHFSELRQKDIDYINNNGGIRCLQSAQPKGAARTSKESIRLKLNPIGQETPKNKKPEILTTINQGNKAIRFGTERLVLKCGAIGYPIPKLKWYRIEAVSNAETEIKAGGDYVLHRNNQFLTIMNVGADKAGQYRCKATNSEGTAEETGNVKVAEYPQWMANGEIVDREPPLGSRLEWPCGAFGGPTYTWYKNGVPLSSSLDGKLEIQSKNSRSYLVIKNVTLEHNGMYQCTAGNEIDIIYSTARLKIKESAPKFSEEMGPVTLIENRTGIIPCPIVASPSPVITWKKNTEPIVNKGKVVTKFKDRVKLAENGRDLVIPKVETEDEGIYTCQGVNRINRISGDSKVSVGKDIHFVAAPVSNRNVTITLRFELQCEAEGDPSYEISYRWLRNGLPLEYSARIHWVKDANRLVILDAIVDDTGTYTCIASAETPQYIEKVKEVDIVVKAPADPPESVWVQGSCWDGDASLAWRVGALNNEEVYEYWIDWATTYDPTNWTRLPKVSEQDPRPVKLDFNRLPPFSQISFRVTIFNRIGPGDPSVPSDPSECITKPAAPRDSPYEIKGVPGGPNTLELEWTPVPQTFWGGPGFNYSVQWRRKTGDEREERWLNLPPSQDIRINDGNNNSVSVKDPGYFVQWEFRIRSNNFKGSARSWTYGTSYSGQDAPTVEPKYLVPDRVTARSADISWRRVAPPKNGTILGYKIQYWHSGIGMEVVYDKEKNITIGLEAIDELEESREERYRDERSVEKRDVEARNRARSLRKRDTRMRNIPLSKNDLQASIVDRYLRSKGISVSKRDTYARNVPRTRSKREDEDENEEQEEPLDLCFNPDEPCYQTAAVKESQLQELMPYKTYHVRIAAYNSGGLGPWSKELVFNTAEAPPGPPYSVNTYAYDKYCKITWKEPRHKNGRIISYQVFGNGIIKTVLPWWQRRYIIWDLELDRAYEAKIRARTTSGWGVPVFRWFLTRDKIELPAKPLPPEVVGYGEDGVNVTFQEPKPRTLRKFGGEMDEDPWELRPVGGYEMENEGVGGYPEKFYVVYRRQGTKDAPKKTEKKQMYGEQDQTWIVIENLQKDTVYEFATIPVNSLGNGPQSDWVRGLTGGIVPSIEKLHWYQRDWFIALIVLFFAAILLFAIVVLTTLHVKDIYYEGAPKRRKDRERERIYEPEDVDGGFSEFTLKSARSSRSVVTSRSEPPPAYNSVLGSVSRHSGDFDDDEDATDSDDEKNEVSTYYSDEKKVPLDDLDEDEEEDSQFATFV